MKPLIYLTLHVFSSTRLVSYRPETPDFIHVVRVIQLRWAATGPFQFTSAYRGHFEKTRLKPAGVGDESPGTAHFDIINTQLPHNTQQL